MTELVVDPEAAADTAEVLAAALVEKLLVEAVTADTTGPAEVDAETTEVEEAAALEMEATEVTGTMVDKAPVGNTDAAPEPAGTPAVLTGMTNTVTSEVTVTVAAPAAAPVAVPVAALEETVANVLEVPTESEAVEETVAEVDVPTDAEAVEETDVESVETLALTKEIDAVVI